MIRVNGKRINVGHFPDGTQMLLDFEIEHLYRPTPMRFVWCYENEAEAFTLMYLKRHLDNNYKPGYRANVELFMPYVPNARMDRVKSDTEVFTLKYFCEFINSLGFDNVSIMDPHSIVSEALINNVNVLRPSNIIYKVIDEMNLNNDYENDIVIYFPDDGAYKRYHDMDCFKNHTCVYGKKERDWKTGKILGIEIYNANGVKITDEINGKDVLMVDDIISYGGTLAYSADKLKELGANYINAYATHVENSILDTERGTLLKRYESGIVNTVFTTNSLYTGKHPMVTVLEEF